jgi:hypothetical protein
MSSLSFLLLRKARTCRSDYDFDLVVNWYIDTLGCRRCFNNFDKFGIGTPGTEGDNYYNCVPELWHLLYPKRKALTVLWTKPSDSQWWRRIQSNTFKKEVIPEWIESFAWNHSQTHNTALHFCCALGNLDALKWMVEDVGVFDIVTKSAFYTDKNVTFDVVSSLLAQELVVAAFEINGASSITHPSTLSMEHKAIVQWLCKKHQLDLATAFVEPSFRNGMTCIYAAAKSSNLPMLKWILEIIGRQEFYKRLVTPLNDILRQAIGNCMFTTDVRNELSGVHEDHRENMIQQITRHTASPFDAIHLNGTLEVRCWCDHLIRGIVGNDVSSVPLNKRQLMLAKDHTSSSYVKWLILRGYFEANELYLILCQLPAKDQLAKELWERGYRCLEKETTTTTLVKTFGNRNKEQYGFSRNYIITWTNQMIATADRWFSFLLCIRHSVTPSSEALQMQVQLKMDLGTAHESARQFTIKCQEDGNTVGMKDGLAALQTLQKTFENIQISCFATSLTPLQSWPAHLLNHLRSFVCPALRSEGYHTLKLIQHLGHQIWFLKGETVLRCKRRTINELCQDPSCELVHCMSNEQLENDESIKFIPRRFPRISNAPNEAANEEEQQARCGEVLNSFGDEFNMNEYLVSYGVAFNHQDVNQIYLNSLRADADVTDYREGSLRV